MSPVLEVTRDRAVARVWLNRPDRHNALSPELVAELTAALRELAREEAIRALVLGGRGPSFCAGVEIATMKDSGGASLEENLAEATTLGAMFAALAEFPRPVIGRIHGNVFGGGVGLVCACDIAVASDDSVFGLSEVRLGILPAVISPYVIRRLGDRSARETMLTGERIGAGHAQLLGFVNHVVPPAELDGKVEERVLALLSGGPRAQGYIKTLLQRYANSPWEEYRAGLPRTLAEVRSGEEAKEGLAAFLEKRKPSWQSGRE